MRALRLVLPLIVLASLLLPATAALAAPANDDRADAAVIASLPATQSQNTSGATLEAGEPQPCGSIGATVWFRVTPADDGVIRADTLGSAYDTVLAGYASGNNNELACNDDVGTGGLWSEISFPVLAGQTYELQAGGFGGKTGNLVLRVSLGPPPLPPPPNDNRADATVIASPLPSTETQTTAGATLEAGEPRLCAPIEATVWFQVTAPQNGWIVADTLGSDFDTVLAGYEPGSSTGLACNDDRDGLQSEVAFLVSASQTYELQVGGYRGATGDLTLNVRFEPLPQGDLFADAIPVDPPVFQHATNTRFATEESEEPEPSCALGVGKTIWYRFEAEDGGALMTTSLTSDFDTVIAVYEQTSPGGGFDSLEEVACNDQTALLLNPSLTVAVPLEAGGSYYIQVSGWFGDFGDLQFTFVGS